MTSGLWIIERDFRLGRESVCHIASPRHDEIICLVYSEWMSGADDDDPLKMENCTKTSSKIYRIKVSKFSPEVDVSNFKIVKHGHFLHAKQRVKNILDISTYHVLWISTFWFRSCMHLIASHFTNFDFSQDIFSREKNIFAACDRNTFCVWQKCDTRRIRIVI